VIEDRCRNASQLDIDNAPVEQALMKQIADDPALQGMISEMFFEQHFNDASVRDRPVLPPPGLLSRYPLRCRCHLTSRHTCLPCHAAERSRSIYGALSCGVCQAVLHCTSSSPAAHAGAVHAAECCVTRQRQ